MCEQRSGIRGCTRNRYHQSIDRLPHLAVGDADHGVVGDIGVQGESGFDLGGIDVDPAAHDHVGFTVGDEDVAFGIDMADIAQGEDTGRDMGSARFLRCVVINHAAP